MQNDDHTFREPKQERSRQSFDKAVEAAVVLTVERRSDAWTLAEVARRAGVSTGSIYGRVDSKDHLIHMAQAREMERIRAAQQHAFGAPVPPGETFRDAVTRVISTLAEVLRTEAPVLAPFMLIAGRDRVVAEEGKRGFEELVRFFCAGLLARRYDIRHPEPERAVSWSFTVVYSVLARWLGLGSDPEAAGEGDWGRILTDLSEMVTTFLGGLGGDADAG
ncbi:TetR/AcrR family transcriptional regulator [Streptomyces griseorubiginosus]|uniref:TetR/AcrR family transcriptional regulator n=1 Tax=Streptomyces griseorubiginosus TaxID=67304 RepID=UPI003634150C